MSVQFVLGIHCVCRNTHTVMHTHAPTRVHTHKHLHHAYTHLQACTHYSNHQTHHAHNHTLAHIHKHTCNQHTHTYLRRTGSITQERRFRAAPSARARVYPHNVECVSSDSAVHKPARSQWNVHADVLHGGQACAPTFAIRCGVHFHAAGASAVCSKQAHRGATCST